MGLNLSETCKRVRQLEECMMSETASLSAAIWPQYRCTYTLPLPTLSVYLYLKSSLCFPHCTDMLVAILASQKEEPNVRDWRNIGCLLYIDRALVLNPTQDKKPLCAQKAREKLLHKKHFSRELCDQVPNTESAASFQFLRILWGGMERFVFVSPCDYISSLLDAYAQSSLKCLVNFYCQTANDHYLSLSRHVYDQSKPATVITCRQAIYGQIKHGPFSPPFILPHDTTKGETFRNCMDWCVPIVLIKVLKTDESSWIIPVLSQFSSPRYCPCWL